MIHRFFIDDIGSGPVSADDGESGVEAGSLRSDAEYDNPLAQQYDPGSADLVMARRIAREAAAVAGAPVEVYLRTNNADYDRVWDEDPDPTYWQPIILKAIFAPKPLEIALKLWGIDVPVKLDVFFPLAEIMAKFGARSLRDGDVIKVPYGAVGNVQPKNFRILTATVDGSYKYAWTYLKCTMESLTGDITVQPDQWAIIPADQQDE